MRKVTQLWIVLPCSLAFTALVLVAYFLDPSYVSDFYILTSMIIAVLWAFFIVPSVLFAIILAKRFFQDKPEEEIYRVSFRIGMIFGYGGLFALCLIASPVMGTMWYIFTIKEIAAAEREKRQTPDDDIFDI